MFRSRRKRTELEAVLRASRPVPRPEFVASIADRVERDAPRRRAGSFRLAFAGGLTAALLVALASFGGFGYAAAGASGVVNSVKRVTAAEQPRTVAGSAAQNQYEGRITICHRTGSRTNPTVTITINANALPAHQRHGDTIGPCPPEGGVAGAEFTSGRRGGSGGAGGVLGVSATLPFTGFTILFAFFAGFALVSAGAALRRTARKR